MHGCPSQIHIDPECRCWQFLLLLRRAEVAVAGVHAACEALLGGDAAEQGVELLAFGWVEGGEQEVVVLAGDAAQRGEHFLADVGEV